MGIDAVVVGSIASVVIAIIVLAVIAYRVIKGMDNKTDK